MVHSSEAYCLVNKLYLIIFRFQLVFISHDTPASSAGFPLFKRLIQCIQSNVLAILNPKGLLYLTPPPLPQRFWKATRYMTRFMLVCIAFSECANSEHQGCDIRIIIVGIICHMVLVINMDTGHGRIHFIDHNFLLRAPLKAQFALGFMEATNTQATRRRMFLMRQINNMNIIQHCRSKQR